MKNICLLCALAAITILSGILVNTYKNLFSISIFCKGSPFRKTPLFAIVLIAVVALLFIVKYIHSIGSVVCIFTILLNKFPFTESCTGLDEIYFLFLSLVPVKPKRKRMTKSEREAFTLDPLLRSILIGLLLGDLHIRKMHLAGNCTLNFVQGFVHKDYIFHLFELFESYCPKAPVTRNEQPHKRTGKVYTSIRFYTYALPCFNVFYDLFHPTGIKTIPLNIGEFLTLQSLCYWISDDGSWDSHSKRVVLCTESFTPVEVELLINVLNDKWDLKCYKISRGVSYRIAIPSYSVPKLQILLAPHMPSMMKHKIGM